MYVHDVYAAASSHLATSVAVVAALSAGYSALQSSRSNRLTILPVLELEIGSELKNTKVEIHNIGTGVAHGVKIEPCHILINKRTPNKEHVKIEFTLPDKDFVAPGSSLLASTRNNPVTWYARSTDEGTALLPIMYSDSAGTRYITVMRVGLSRIDMKLSPRVLTLPRRIQYIFLYHAGLNIKLFLFKHMPDDKKLQSLK